MVKVKDHNAEYIDSDWLDTLAKSVGKTRKLSPPAFRYLLTEKARKAEKTIVLPEGNEPRTIKAAAICGQRGIAKTILLGDRDEILRIAEQQGIELNEHVTVIEPSSIINDYVAPMVEIRKNKGLTEVVAQEQLQDHVVLGTMMLEQGKIFNFPSDTIVL